VKMTGKGKKTKKRCFGGSSEVFFPLLEKIEHRLTCVGVSLRPKLKVRRGDTVAVYKMLQRSKAFLRSKNDSFR